MKISKALHAGALLLATTCIASAQDTVTLKFGSHLAAHATGIVQGAKIVMEHAEKSSNGAIKFEFYPSEQAGKAVQLYDLVRAGAVDIGTISTSYVGVDKLPLVSVQEIPGLAQDICGVVKAMDVLGAPGGAIFENDFKRAGVRVLAYLPYPPFGPSASTKPITKVEDLQGMKLRTAGSLMELSVQKLQGVPVRMTTPEIFEALSRGTVDGIMYPYITVKDYDLNSVAKYGVTGYSFGTPGDLIMISEKRFQSLSEAQQASLLAAGKAASQHWCKHVDTAEPAAIQAMKDAGMTIHTWSEADVDKINALTADVADGWAKNLEERGRPGKAVLEAFKAALAD